MTSSRQLARTDPALARLLVPNSGGWSRDGDAFTSIGWRAAGQASLAARLAPSADGVLDVGVQRDAEHRLQIRAVGANSSSVGTESDGHLSYPDAYPSTDLVVAATARRVEQFLLLRDESAPRRFVWTVARGAALAEVRQTASEGITFRDDTGRAVMGIPPAFALDRTGKRRDATLALRGEELSVELDTNGLEFPILLDPAIESFVWLQVAATPPGGAGGSIDRSPLAFDSRAGRNVTVLFGGAIGGAVKRSGTDEWNGTSWTQKCATGTCGPLDRSDHALAFHDSATKGVLMFGGAPNTFSFMGDTWLWDGSTWAVQCAACSATVAPLRPADRAFHAMAYHAGYGTVLFGGQDGSGQMGDTWVWNGTTWTKKCTACVTGTSQPSARAGHAMVYDAARNKTVLFGGSLLGVKSSETWLWDATSETWSQACVGCVADTTKPTARVDFGMAYDSRRKKVVLNGVDSGGTLGETWEWDGTVWSKVDVALNGHVSPGMAFDSSRGRVVRYGGYDGGSPKQETWEYHARGGGCTSAADCDTGYCVDSVCCEVSSCPSCQSCDVASGTGPGQCNVIKDAPDPSGCSGANRCDAAGVCKLNEGQTCSLASQCAVGNCVDATCCANTCPTACRSCANASGACTTLVTNQDDNNCNGVNTCSAAGDCKKNNGQTCSLGTDCASGNCVDGTCCADSCTAPCRSCANAAGTCTTVVSSQDDNNCGGVNSCDAVGTCKKKAGQGCLAAGDCVSGFCADGYCCDTACSGGCDVCSAAGVCTVLGAGAPGQCGAYKCGGGAACPTNCSADSQCSVGNYCGGGACLPLKGLGLPCNVGSECALGVCADGVCCNTGCTGKCMACAAANKQDGNPANSGTCNAAKQGTNPGNGCVVSSDPCGDQATCSGTPGECAKAANGKSCGPTTCANGAVSGKICNGSGVCVDQTNAQCAPYVCKGSACSSPCTADTDCQTDFYCAGGVCVGKSDNGKGCSAANTCKSGFCVDTVCCDSPCAGQCQACAEVGSVGQCKVVSGEPRAPRQACLGTAPDKCKGACDGANPTACTYPPRERAARTQRVPATSLNRKARATASGSARCPPPRTACPMHNAGSGACNATCSSDTDCAQGAKCDTTQGKCAVTSATCSDPFTVLLPNGQSQSCSPYKCVGGACQQQCSSANDCASGFNCEGAVCVAADGGTDSGVGGTSGSGGSATGGSATGGSATGGSATGGSATGGSSTGGKKGDSGADEGGCGCRVPASSGGSNVYWLGALALAALGRRRARNGSVTGRG
ncbi:MAG: hypothetical protein IPI67_17010 [Myxococcales bacterium]|nr:hypothetical protein [Myxococcales bacterium]